MTDVQEKRGKLPGLARPKASVIKVRDPPTLDSLHQRRTKRFKPELTVSRSAIVSVEGRRKMLEYVKKV